jgi:hypothetical protein
LGIIILLKFIFDWISYDNGFKKGYDLKRKEIIADPIINKFQSQKKQLMIEIDSLDQAKDSTRNR